MNRFSDIPVYFGYIQRHDCPSQQLSDKMIRKLFTHLINSFDIEYAFKSIFSSNFVLSDQLFLNKQFNDFIANVVNYSKEDREAIKDTLFELSSLNERNAIFCPLNALNHIFKYFKDINEKCKREEITIGSNNPEIQLIPRCILTPTRLLMLRPEPTLTSRVMDISEPEYTIRLLIREDNFQSLQYSVGNSEKDFKFLQNTIKKPLIKGIPIGGRVYELLGSSTSQLRDAGLSLYAMDSKDRTAQNIKEEIGDLSGICDNVSKYVARLGLAFSQVMTHIKVPKCQTDVEPDIKTNITTNCDKFYTFSDGIGRVSMDIMYKICQKLNIERKDMPSAMQIRYGGCKGMLVIDPTLKGEKKIIFRESMYKYKSNVKNLGIIKLSAPRSLSLNRPLITILDQLGVDAKVFLNMLFKELRLLSKAMICECSATQLLQTSSTLRIPYQKLLDSDIPFLSEPLFRQIIDSVINHRIKELKFKARIKVPMNSGRTVFGVLDETATLEYGKVFVQISKMDLDNMPLDKNSTEILKGEIMVTKFPCLHPGDVRKLEAVDVEALHHIKDCIVFPQKGPRPHCNEMAGSDLDGDEYAVIWNSPLIFGMSNEKAMDFPDPDPVLLGREANNEDILDFYCNYIVNNNVGLMANAHLAKADTEKDGIFSEVCMSLAEKYSIALDFAKTGKPVTIDRNEKPSLYPDFMEKFARKRTQLSKRILGQLYRHCDRISLGMQSNMNLEIESIPNQRLEVKGYEKFIKSAETRYLNYKMIVEDLLKRFHVNSEAALLSGAFTQTSKYSGKSEAYDNHEILEDRVNQLFISFKNFFKSDANNDCSEEKLQRVSAWYMIPFLIDKEVKHRYFGFSWTISEELCDLFKSKTPKQMSEKTKEEHNCFESVAKLLDDYFENHYLNGKPELTQEMDIADQRQKIMEERCKTSEKVIKGWLERQDHLLFKRYVGQQLTSSKDYVLSDMELKLQRKLKATRNQVLEEAGKHTEMPLKSAGSLVMKFFTDSIDEWFSEKTLDYNNRVVDTPLIKFGFSSFITLNHFFKTRQISHIIDLSPNFRISLSALICDEVFFIPLPEGKKLNNGNKDIYELFTQYMVQREDEFIDKLKRLSGAIEIYLEPYQLKTKRLKYHYLMAVRGTVWAIQAVKKFVCHPSFFKIVTKNEHIWKRPNLRYLNTSNGEVPSNAMEAP